MQALSHREVGRGYRKFIIKAINNGKMMALIMKKLSLVNDNPDLHEDCRVDQIQLPKEQNCWVELGDQAVTAQKKYSEPQPATIHNWVWCLIHINQCKREVQCKMQELYLGATAPSYEPKKAKAKRQQPQNKSTGKICRRATQRAKATY
ncbi:hypothetical protein C8J56DRAFT_889508 [Mycena floridula]|nr:hypothetical protein C8J56DRAFT_889508 [Mycena floridula]